MKCSACQHEMTKSERGFLCLNCGHLDAGSTPHDVPLTPASAMSDEPNVTAELPVAPPIAPSTPVPAEASLAPTSPVVAVETTTAPTGETPAPVVPNETATAITGEPTAETETPAAHVETAEETAAAVEAALAKMPPLPGNTTTEVSPTSEAASASEPAVVTDPVASPVIQKFAPVEISAGPATPTPTESTVVVPPTSTPEAQPGADAPVAPPPESVPPVSVPPSETEPAASAPLPTAPEAASPGPTPEPAAPVVTTEPQAEDKPAEPPPVVGAKPVAAVGAPLALDGIAQKPKTPVESVKVETASAPTLEVVPGVPSASTPNLASEPLKAETHPGQGTSGTIVAMIVGVIAVSGLGTAGYLMFVK